MAKGLCFLTGVSVCGVISADGGSGGGGGADGGGGGDVVARTG